MAYEINGVEWPSVTQLTGQLGKGDALTYWASKCACEYVSDNRDRLNENHGLDTVLKEAVTAFKNVSKTALTAGSIAHNAIEVYIKTGKAPIIDNEQASRAFEAFLEWESLNHVEWLESELTLLNQELGYAGTCDAIARINGHVYLIDFKTSKAVYDEYRYQLAAYVMAKNSISQEKISRTAVLRIDKESAEFDFKDLSKTLSEDMRTFSILVSLFYSQKKRRLKNNPFVQVYWGKK